MSVILDISIIIIIATIFAIIARLLKQPAITSYIIAGLLIGPVGLSIIKNESLILALSEIGISFLVFFAGLELNFKKLKGIGKITIYAGLIQVVLISLLSFLVLLKFSFAKTELLIISVAISFSSTALIVKLLADKQKLSTLHARISIGILLVQDIIAIIFLAIISGGKLSALSFALPLLKLFLLSAFALILGFFILPKILKSAAKSTELLMLTAIAICFLFALFAMAPVVSNLSLVVGAFIAGITLANSPFKVEIQNSIKPLRDFFVTIFFVSIGMQVTFAGMSSIIIPMILLLLIVVVIEPYLTMTVVRIFKYTKRTSFLTGLLQAQTSEFSLILVSQAFILGYITKVSMGMIVLITIITMALTPFLSQHEHFFFSKFARSLNIFEKLPSKEPEYREKGKKSIILFGCHRMGTIFLKALEKESKKILVVDFDPDIIYSLKNRKISCIYGDANNAEVLNKINWHHVELVIITIPDKDENIELIKTIKNKNPESVIFSTADFIPDAFELYSKGADYVILPQIVGGEKGLLLLNELKKSKTAFKKIKQEHIAYLKKLYHFMH